MQASWQAANLLEYGFYKKSLQKDATLTRSALIWKKSEPKVFNWSELHLSTVTSYKIHILVEHFLAGLLCV